MDNETIRNLDLAIAKTPPTPQALDAFRLADIPVVLNPGSGVELAFDPTAVRDLAG